MRNTHVLISACLTALAAATFAAHAEDVTDAFAKRLFAVPSVEHKTFACFVRSYDTAHLARHRKQTVSAMKLLVLAEKLPEDAALSYSFRINVKVRNRKGEFTSNSSCGHARLSEKKGEGVQVDCGGDCGGGGLAIGIAADDKAVILKLEEIGVWSAEKPDDESRSFELRGGADDRVFRLDRVSNEICAPLLREGEELAALPPK